MKIENLITQKVKRDRKQKFVRMAVWGLLVGSFTSLAVFDQPKTSPKPLERKIEVKAVENIPKDWSTDLVGYFRHRGEEVGYTEYDITKLHGVMDCENGLHTADRKNYLYDGENGRYTAGGFAMITNSTWRQHKCTGSKWNGIDNINCFYKIIGRNGLGDYRESKSCWGKKFNEHSIRYIEL